MNRNLTYLTGLSEPVDQPLGEKESVVIKSTPLQEEETEEEEPLGRWASILKGRAEMQRYFEQNHRRMWSLAMTVLGGICATLFATWLQSSGILSNERSSTSSTALSSVASVTSTPAVSTATTTVVINITSTKTVNLKHAEASVSPLASALSFAGLLSDKASTTTFAEPEPKNTICSIERYSSNEILVRIPTSKKAGWLAKGAIDIDVFRGEEPVKAKLSSVDEGIVVELNKKDAYGVLNISVITTRKPKINETFEVNFGKPLVVEALEAGMQVVFGIAGKVVHTAEEAAHMVEDTCAAAANKIRDETASIADQIREAGHTAQSFSQRAANGARDSLDPKHLARAVQDARDRFTDRVAAAKADMQLTVLKAQITSKLWSLKVQGRTEEHAKYEKKAADHLKKKHEELMRSLRSSQEIPPQANECGCSSGSKRTVRRCLKKCGSSRRGTAKAAGRWRKMVAG
jgi:hypothetical protein